MLRYLLVSHRIPCAPNLAEGSAHRAQNSSRLGEPFAAAARDWLVKNWTVQKHRVSALQQTQRHAHAVWSRRAHLLWRYATTAAAAEGCDKSDYKATVARAPRRTVDPAVRGE